jgi:hypothetical protein
MVPPSVNMIVRLTGSGRLDQRGGATPPILVVFCALHTERAIDIGDVTC